MEVRLASDGERVVVRANTLEFAVLEASVLRLEEVLTDPQAHGRAIERLFPPTYAEDAEAETEHRRLIGEAMLERRRDAMEAFTASLESVEGGRWERELVLCGSEQALWLRVLNDLRLVFALELGVEENGDLHSPPADPALEALWEQWRFLSGVQALILHARGFDVEDSGAPPEEG